MSDKQINILIALTGLVLTGVSVYLAYNNYKEGKELREIQKELAKDQLEQVEKKKSTLTQNG